MRCLNLSFDAKHDMRAYFILYLVKWKYCNDLVSKVFCFAFGKMKVLETLNFEGEKNHKKGGLNCVFGNFFFYVLDNCPQVQSLK